MSIENQASKIEENENQLAERATSIFPRVAFEYGQAE
jgi:hypothetical protein